MVLPKQISVGEDDLLRPWQRQRKTVNGWIQLTTLTSILWTIMTEENEDHYSVDLFQQFVTEFVMFSAVNGTAVPCKASNTIVYKWEERELACFIDTTNKSLRKCPFHLSKKQVQILKKRDYPFSVSVDESWEHGFCLLENYKEDHGNCDAHRRDPDIGRWLSYQRECYKKGFL